MTHEEAIARAVELLERQGWATLRTLRRRLPLDAASLEALTTELCVDVVLPPLGDTSGTSGKFMNVNMLVLGVGKERTEPQWRALFEKAGFTITSITPLDDNFGTSIVTGIKNEAKTTSR
jgi:hypothetical protein